MATFDQILQTLTGIDIPFSPLIPDNPGAPGGPLSPGSPVFPGKPGRPEVPLSPLSPGGPSGPRKPGIPGPPICPGEPFGPGSPSYPSLPGDPGGPGNPLGPGEPGGPGVPCPPLNVFKVKHLKINLYLLTYLPLEDQLDLVIQFVHHHQANLGHQLGLVFLANHQTHLFLGLLFVQLSLVGQIYPLFPKLLKSVIIVH